MKNMVNSFNGKSFIAIILWVVLVAGVSMPYSMIESTAGNVEEYLVSAQCNEGGEITPEGNKFLKHGDSQTYTITPNYGYVVRDVIIDGNSRGPLTEYTLENVEADHTVYVEFARKSGDLNKNGICDYDDIQLIKQALLSDEYADTNRDGSTDVIDLARGIRQKTLLGKSFENEQIWSVSDESVVQFSESKLEFSGTGNALTLENFGRDYCVSADIIMEGLVSGRNGSISLISRRTGNCYYDYRLEYYGGLLSVALYRYGNNGTTTELVTYSKNYIQNMVHYRVIAIGETLRMRLLCKGDTLYCFINDCLIGSYVDTDATAPKNGVAGIKVLNAHGNVRGFEVQPVEALSIAQINTKNLEQNSFRIYEGGSLHETERVLNGICMDGTILTTHLAQTEISAYDSLKVGRQEIEVDMLDSKIQMPLIVNQRREVISTISTELETLTEESTSEKIRALLKQYDSLTEYEKELCSDRAVQNHDEAVQTLALLNSNGKDKLLVFDNYAENEIRWGTGVEIQRGETFKENGRYYIEQTKHEIAANCWRTVEKLYGKISSVSADMLSSSVYNMIGLTINVGSSGYYYARVLFHVTDDGQRGMPTVRLFKKTTSDTTLAIATPSEYGISLSPDSWFNMKVAYADGVVSVYIDDVKMIEYDDSAAVEQFCYGSAGVFSFAGDSCFDNFIACGEEATPITSSSDINTTYYAQGFENITLGENADDWVTSSTDYDWEVTASGMAYHLYGLPNYLTGYLGASEWTDYAVNCDVSLGEGEITDTTTATIVARSTNKQHNGYEFGLYEDADGTTYFKLYKRGVSSGKINGEVCRVERKIVRGRTYNLMLLVSGNRLLGYCDGVLIFDITDATDPYLKGYAGIRSANTGRDTVLSTYDNYIVYALGEDDNLSYSGQQRTILYSDTFDEEEKMTAKGWYSDTVGNKTSSHCYGTVAAQHTSTELHVFENNPVISFDFLYREVSDGNFGFEIRKAGETAYVRIGYDTVEKTWYVQESICDVECVVNSYYVPASVQEDEWHSANIIANGSFVQFLVDGETIFDLKDVSQISYGKIGIFAEGAAFYIDNVFCEFPSGDTIQAGLVEYYIGDDYAASFEIENLGDGNMIGVGYNIVAVSEDYGKSFVPVNGGNYATLEAGGAYSSMLKLHDGSFIFIRQNDFQVNKTTDNMQTWECIGTVMPSSEMKDSVGRRTSMFHVNALSEVQLTDGTWRILLPVGKPVYSNAYSASASGNYTVVYYSDDGGRTWNVSQNDTRDIILCDFSELEISEWCEAKIIQCSDGSLRMYCSRNNYGCMQYTVSYDGGVTWNGMFPLAQMQCALSSFSITKGDDGMFYMVWVNDTPLFLGEHFARSRLSLARSTDGINWEFLCDIERTAPYVWSNDYRVATPVFQIVDPSITVTDDYVYVSYGCSDKTLEYGNGYHNAQRIKVVRIEKDKLSVKEWNAYNVSNMTFVQTAELTKTPQTTFDQGDTFVYAGGEVTVSTLDGVQKVFDTKQFYILHIPDMTTVGTHEIVLYNRNGFSVSYKIQVQ